MVDEINCEVTLYGAQKIELSECHALSTARGFRDAGNEWRIVYSNVGL